MFNSSELHDHFVRSGYAFEREYVFEPTLNSGLMHRLQELGGHAAKRRRILVYGRPRVGRNAFRLAVEVLRRWIETYPDSSRWEIISAGEEHPAVYLDGGRLLVSAGKLSIDEYAEVLAESSVGLSLMVSPHPSYPPLEMAAFGAHVVTNGFGGKDLSGFSPLIESVPLPTIDALAQALARACDAYEAEVELGKVRKGYLGIDDPFGFVPELARTLREFTVARTLARSFSCGEESGEADGLVSDESARSRSNKEHS